MRFYGAALWRDARYPTRDRVVPAGWFLRLERAMPALRAQERLEQLRAVSLAMATVMGDEQGRVKRQVDLEVREATGHG